MVTHKPLLAGWITHSLTCLPNKATHSIKENKSGGFKMCGPNQTLKLKMNGMFQRKYTEPFQTNPGKKKNSKKSSP